MMNPPTCTSCKYSTRYADLYCDRNVKAIKYDLVEGRDVLSSPTSCSKERNSFTLLSFTCVGKPE